MSDSSLAALPLTVSARSSGDSVVAGVSVLLLLVWMAAAVSFISSNDGISTNEAVCAQLIVGVVVVNVSAGSVSERSTRLSDDDDA